MSGLERIKFVAINVGEEIDIQRFSSEKLGKEVLLPSDEPLVFDFAGSKVMVFYFGSIVVINPQRSVEELIDEFRDFISGRSLEISEEYELVVSSTKKEVKNKLGISFEGRVAAFDDFCVMVGRKKLDVVEKTIAYALAQSVALERIEKRVDECSDRLSKAVEKFKKWTLWMRTKPIVTSILEVIKIRQEVYSNIMLLDKPEFTWEDEEIEELYEELREVFDLDDRLAALDRELDSIFQSADILSSLVSTGRENLLELLIVLLILMEIIMYVYEIWGLHV